MSAHPSDPHLNPEVARSSATDPSEPASDGRSRIPADPVESAAQELDATIRAELDAMETATRDLAARARKLGAGARAVNGLAGACVVWAREYEATADKVGAEGAEVSKALLGIGVIEITTHTNPELAAAAASDPERKR